jgi:hypothetical protein
MTYKKEFPNRLRDKKVVIRRYYLPRLKKTLLNYKITTP